MIFQGDRDEANTEMTTEEDNAGMLHVQGQLLDRFDDYTSRSLSSH